VNEQELKPVLVFEYNDNTGTFIDIERKFPLYKNLDSDKLVLFIDFTLGRAWLWYGSNTTTQMQSNAKSSVGACIVKNLLLKKFPNFIFMKPRMKFILTHTITRHIEEGIEPTQFKIFVGLAEEIDYPEFKVNELITLRLIDDKTFIYIKSKRFIQCMRLFLHIPQDKTNLYEKIESIDEATEIFDEFLFENTIIKGEFLRPIENHSYIISPEEEFWGHCSNLQAWVEHNYDTRLLHSNLSFPLLKELSDAGDQFALIRFKEEIVNRLEAGYFPVILYLIKENYIRYLSPDYLLDLRKRFTGKITPQIFNLLKRESFAGERKQQKPLSQYIKFRKLKEILYVPHIVNQMEPKDFVLGLASLDFTYLDFFMSPNLKNKEVYFEDLAERLFEGLKSKDSLFFKATKHFIERIFGFIFSTKESIQDYSGTIQEKRSHQLIKSDDYESCIVSIKWLLERIIENNGKDIIKERIKLYSRTFKPKVYSQIRAQLDLVEDVESFRNLLNHVLELNKNRNARKK